MYNLVSFAGIFILMAFAWALSTNRKVINWRVVIWGVGLQLLIGVFIFIIPVGAKLFLFLNDVVIKVLDSAAAGTKFLFGRLALPPGAVNEAGEGSLGFILAFQALPTIVFFASLMGLLYYIGFMPWLIGIFSRGFTRLMRISGAESLCTASNIFVGIESATTIRPYIERMTPSELCTILTAGMATVASSVLALYVFILHSQFPTIAGHLISASLLSAPAAIVMSKLLMPETGKPETLGIDVHPSYEKESTLMESIINGANAGMKLVIGIMALLLALLGIVALVDLVLTAAGSGVNSVLNVNFDWSLKGLLGYIFYPFTLIIGVPPSDAVEIAKIIGERAIVTEVKSYQDLAVLLTNQSLHDPRSAFIAVYALCGFAHVASLAIFVGGIAALAPNRAGDISRVGLRALLAATLACLMTAAVAGTFYMQGMKVLVQ
ncbi:MAG: nucleoside transporter [Nitrospirae bacterium GWC2_57_13]|nr:MAG: nucleoside transporter [Nitrospirae bacterium GWC1_57_7]OGW28534.1 MAG: nucleoside transporter [Nitrospirae bacterium GWC2_57_13]HAS54843.1 nucleoside transporter [Nitrospiraceae bacterium]